MPRRALSAPERARGRPTLVPVPGYGHGRPSAAILARSGAVRVRRDGHYPASEPVRRTVMQVT